MEIRAEPSIRARAELVDYQMNKSREEPTALNISLSLYFRKMLNEDYPGGILPSTISGLIKYV